MYDASGMNKRALFIAILFGIVGAALLALYQRKFEVEASGGDKVKLLIAVKRIERGKPLTDEVLAIREIPLAYVDDRAIRESDRPKILGLKVGNAVKEQQLVLWSDLKAVDERKDLSALVLPGYRAVSIKAAREETSIALVRPGDYVDVIGVLGDKTGEAKNAVVLFQRILVLAIGTDTSAEQAKDTKENSSSNQENLITLSLTLNEAQVIALAAERGRLAVAVRHPDDPARTNGIVDLNINQIVNEQERAKIPNVRTGPRDITAGQR